MELMTTKSQELSTWEPLQYSFESEFEWDNKDVCTGTITLNDSRKEYNVINNKIVVQIKRTIPLDEHGDDSRSSKQQRKATGYVYSVCVEGTENLDIDFSNIGTGNLQSALDEIVTILSIELDHAREEGYSSDVHDLIQAAQLEAMLKLEETV